MNTAEHRGSRRSTKITALFVLTAVSVIAALHLFLPRIARRAPFTVLTQEEREWLDENSGSLTLYFNTQFPPIEFASPKGDFTGLGSDVVTAVEQRLGVEFIRQPCEDWNLHLQALAEGDCAVAPTIVRTAEREEYAFFTEPYARVPVVIITTRSRQESMRMSDLEGLRVAVVSGYATEQYLQGRNQGNIQVVPVWNVQDGLRMVSFGEVDAFLENLAVAAYYADEEGLSNLRVAGATDYYFAWSIGVSRKYPLLYSAVQKALADIPERDLEAMQKRWISMQTHEGMSPEALSRLRLAALFLSALLVSLTAITLFLKRRLDEKVESLQLAQNDLLDKTKRLQQAEKMEALGTLAGGIAHDFNNLLQVIGGFAQVLIARKRQGDPDHRELNQIVGASRRAAALIHQLLAFSRKMETRKIPLNLNREVGNVVGILRHTLPRMIRITLEPGEGLWTVSADPVHIEQILLNLAGNAVDAMEQGGGLTFRTGNMVLEKPLSVEARELPPGRYVILSVSDTGSGMEQEVVERIFDPFFTTKEPGRGTGLGLASVYGIVSDHGGIVQCRSRVGEGTTFEILLPASPDQGTEGTGDEKPEGSQMPGGGETILVVDDEPDILVQTKELLISYGYRVATAESGEMALEVFEKLGGVDLVLLDLNMPGMGGYRCLAELLGIDPEVRVIIVSGHSAFDGDGAAAGARGFIGKPYRINELAARIREVLDEPPATAKQEKRLNGSQA